MKILPVLLVVAVVVRQRFFVPVAIARAHSPMIPRSCSQTSRPLRSTKIAGARDGALHRTLDVFDATHEMEDGRIKSS